MQLLAVPYTPVAWLVMDVSGKSPETQKLSHTDYILEHCTLKKMACTQQLSREKQAGGRRKHLLSSGKPRPVSWYLGGILLKHPAAAR